MTSERVEKAAELATRIMNVTTDPVWKQQTVRDAEADLAQMILANMRQACEAEMKRKVITHRDRWVKTDPAVILTLLNSFADSQKKIEVLREALYSMLNVFDEDLAPMTLKGRVCDKAIAALAETER
jgi:hypothetical protein